MDCAPAPVAPAQARIVLTLGTFDILHSGHVAFLRRARALGTALIVGVNTDGFAASFKRQPVMDEDERMHAVSQLGCIVLPNRSAGRELIGAVRPAVLAVGSDWARRDYYAQIGCDQDWLDDRGIILALVPYTAGISTSEIIRRIRG